MVEQQEDGNRPSFCFCTSVGACRKCIARAFSAVPGDDNQSRSAAFLLFSCAIDNISRLEFWGLRMRRQDFMFAIQVADRGVDEQ